MKSNAHITTEISRSSFGFLSANTIPLRFSMKEKKNYCPWKTTAIFSDWNRQLLYFSGISGHFDVANVSKICEDFFISSVGGFICNDDCHIMHQWPRLGLVVRKRINRSAGQAGNALLHQSLWRHWQSTLVWVSVSSSPFFYHEAWMAESYYVVCIYLVVENPIVNLNSLPRKD